MPQVMVHELAALLSKLTADYRSSLLRFLSDLAVQWGRWKERRGDGAFSKALEVRKSDEKTKKINKLGR